jgi:hypothetical protein
LGLGWKNLDDGVPCVAGVKGLHKFILMVQQKRREPFHHIRYSGCGHFQDDSGGGVQHGLGFRMHFLLDQREQRVPCILARIIQNPMQETLQKLAHGWTGRDAQLLQIMAVDRQSLDAERDLAIDFTLQALAQ